MQKNDVTRLLIGSGFDILSADSQPNYLIFKVERTEILGARMRYTIAIAEDNFSETDINYLTTSAKRTGLPSVLISKTVATYQDGRTLTHEQFADRLGGPILSLLPFEEEYSRRLIELGSNRLPDRLQGDPSKIFEQYVHAGLQFIFRSRVIPYGQERSFEKVADGIAVGGHSPILLYDAKAYADGYPMTSTSIRQFADYVNGFHERYAHIVGRATAFLVLSGSFQEGKRAHENRSRELRAATSGVGICFVTTEVLGSIVDIMVEQPMFRSTVDWKGILMETDLSADTVKRAVEACKRDAVIG